MILKFLWNFIFCPTKNKHIIILAEITGYLTQLFMVLKHELTVSYLFVNGPKTLFL